LPVCGFPGEQETGRVQLSRKKEIGERTAGGEHCRERQSRHQQTPLTASPDQDHDTSNPYRTKETKKKLNAHI